MLVCRHSSLPAVVDNRTDVELVLCPGELELEPPVVPVDGDGAVEDDPVFDVITALLDVLEVFDT